MFYHVCVFKLGKTFMFFEKFQSLSLRFLKAPNGEPVIIATDLIEALKGNKNNSSEIVKNNVRSKWWIDLPNPNGGHKIRCLFEPGAYQLAGNPMFQTDIAEQFQDWLFEEVLPKLRASGYYIMPTATSEQLEAAQAEINKLSKKYVESERLRINARNSVISNGFIPIAQVNKIFGYDDEDVMRANTHKIRLIKACILTKQIEKARNYIRECIPNPTSKVEDAIDRYLHALSS